MRLHGPWCHTIMETTRTDQLPCLANHLTLIRHESPTPMLLNSRWTIKISTIFIIVTVHRRPTKRRKRKRDCVFCFMLVTRSPPFASFPQVSSLSLIRYPYSHTLCYNIVGVNQNVGIVLNHSCFETYDAHQLFDIKIGICMFTICMSFYGASDWNFPLLKFVLWQDVFLLLGVKHSRSLFFSKLSAWKDVL